jgi:hypothetical protein
MKAAMTGLSQTYPLVKFPCAAHLVQLCVNSALAEVGDVDAVLTKCHELTHLMKQIGAFREAVKTQQQEADPTHKPLTFIDDIIMRWNSQYNMMRRVIRLYHFILAVRNDIRDTDRMADGQRLLARLERALLTEHELLIANDMLMLLAPVLDFTNLVNSAKKPGLPKVYPWVYDWCQRERPELETVEGEDLFDNLTRHIRTRWPLNAITDTVAVTTYLCAGWKTHALFDIMVTRNGEQIRLMDRVKLVLEQQVRMLAEGGLGAGQAGGSDPDSSAEESDPENPRPCALIRAGQEELARYNAYSIVSLERVDKYRDDPLSWWAKHTKGYKLLSILAQQYLSMQASSVAAVRLFSDAGNVVTKKRTSLNPTTIENILFLRRYVVVDRDEDGEDDD